MFNRVCILLFVIFSFTYSDTLIVNVSEYPPMVINNDGKLEGYSIDLWKQIANTYNWDYKFVMVDSFSQIFPNIITGKADVAASGVSVTAEREKIIDYSYSFFDTGISALVMKDKIEIISYVKSQMEFYIHLTLKLIPFLLSWLAYVWLWALILWKLEQGNEMFNDQFDKGWLDAKFFVHVVISSTGFGNQIPMSKWGRNIAVILMYSGIGFMFPMITGKITTEMSQKVPYTCIREVKDLKDRKVVVLEGRTSADLAKRYGTVVTEVETIREALLHLKAGEVDAFIYDRPALQYIAQTDETVNIVKDNFNEEKYAMVLPKNSPIEEEINLFLLQARENGLLKGLYDKWIKVDE